LEQTVMNSIKILTLPENFGTDQRGWSFAPFKNLALFRSAAVDWNSLHAVSLNPGAIRGNHLHPLTTEWLFFCGGPVRLSWQESPGTDPLSIVINDHHTLVIIPPGVSHAIKNESAETVYLVAFRTAAPSAEGPEVLRAVILE
jgi:oxalate decarboxylase/phosphoglucose isomerase-like protein (cupin superfamily)